MDKQLLERGERLIQALNQNFYLMTSPVGFPIPSVVNGLALSHDVVLREHLIAEGRWRGPAPMIVVPSTLSSELLLGVVAHEAAHCCEFAHAGVVEDYEPVPADFERSRTKLAMLAKDVAAEPTLPRWLGAHGPSFIRVALHLHQRAWSAGFEVGLPEMAIAGPTYHLSAAWKYKSVLAPELESMASASMTDVLSTPIPRSFMKFFREDAVRCSPFNKTKRRLAA